MSGNQVTALDAERGPARDWRREVPHARPSGNETTPLQVLMRRKWSILAGAVLVTAAATFVVLKMPVRYESTASIVVDPRQLKVMSAESLMTAQSPDPMLLRTRMEELRSPQIARAVVEQLGLNRHPEYCDPPLSLSERASRWLGLGPADKLERAAPGTAGPGSCEVSVATATERLIRRISGSTDGRSFMIQVRAEAADPQLAATIANAYAGVFIVRRREEMQEVAQQAKIWLTHNASELRDKMQTAASAVEEYRAQYRLAPLRGETLAALSLQERNTQLSAATGDLAAKRATLDQLNQVVQRNGSIEASTTAQASPAMARLVEAHGALLANNAQLQARLGASHPDVIASNARVERSRQQIREEAGKAVAALSAEVQAQEARRNALQKQVRDLESQFADQGQADVRLRDLEREATLTRDLYSTLLTRLTQIQAEQSLQVADVRLAVEAQVPDIPFAPRTKMILVGVFLASLGTGAMLALARDLLSRIFSDSDQVEEETGLPVLGFFPTPSRGRDPQAMVIDSPNSIEAEAVYSVLTSLTGRQYDRPGTQGQVIMITSALPNEGKTSFCVALGRAAARSGLKALVIDCDLRRPSLARVAGLPERDGSRRSGTERAQEALLFGEPAVDQMSSLHVLPVHGPVSNPHEALASSRLPSIVGRLRETYDIIILDTPPVLAVSDPVNLARLADDVMLVVSWRKATRMAVVAALKALNRNGALATSIVLSKVDLRRYARGFGADTGLARPYVGYHATAKLDA